MTAVVSVLVVTYNSANVIESCLAALGTNADIEVIVHDNNSLDETLNVVASIAPHAVVIRSGCNAGFAAGVNSAASVATGAMICLLNPDAVVSASALLEMARILRDDASVGVVAPLLEHPTNRLRIREGGRLPTGWRVFTHYSGASRFAHRWSVLEGMYLLASDTRDVNEVGWVSGAVLMARRLDWDRVGGMTERWFMYAEDVHFCHKISESGLKVILLGTVKGQHALGGSTDSAPSSNPAWVVNLYDLYKSDLSSGIAHNVGWKVIMTAGLASRAALFAAMSLIRPAESSVWRGEALRFLAFARAVSRQSVALPGAEPRTGRSNGIPAGGSTR